QESFPGREEGLEVPNCARSGGTGEPDTLLDGGPDAGGRQAPFYPDDLQDPVHEGVRILRLPSLLEPLGKMGQLQVGVGVDQGGKEDGVAKIGARDARSERTGRRPRWEA
ncbi:MAG: hypothetical protein P8Z70_11590, partial [Desulfuromonadales bacterium]